MITRESLHAAGACYTDERIAELVPTEGLTPSQVAALDIPADDRHWALVYAAGASDRTLRLHACWCARQAIALVASPDPRSIAAVETSERYLRGVATEAELEAAEAAGWAAARAAGAAARAAGDAAWAAWAAARAAARDAARAAARASARAAGDAAGDAWAAARAAARDAARAAARASARAAGDAQVADLAQRLEAER